MPFAYYIRRLKNLCSPQQLNADGDETVSCWLRLARYACVEPDNDAAQDAAGRQHCCECNRLKQKQLSHVIAPEGMVVPFLSFHAGLINDALQLWKHPEQRSNILSKPDYKGCEASFIAWISTRRKTWQRHEQVITEMLVSCPLLKALAEHRRDKISKQTGWQARDAAGRRLRPDKIIAQSFVRKYQVLLSQFVLKLTTYHFFRPPERPFTLSPG